MNVQEELYNHISKSLTEIPKEVMEQTSVTDIIGFLGGMQTFFAELVAESPSIAMWDKGVLLDEVTSA